MKKFIFLLFILLHTIIIAEVADISFILKGGLSPIGYYKEVLTTPTLDIEQTEYVKNSLNLKLEFHGRSNLFQSLFWGAGVGYIGSGTLENSINGSTELGVDYFPIYLLLQTQYNSNYYYEWDMFFAIKGGLSYERDKGRIGTNSGLTNILSSPSPYFGLAFGFESYNMILEFFYDLNIGASTDLTELGKSNLIMKSDRIGINLGYRFNSSWKY